MSGCTDESVESPGGSGRDEAGSNGPFGVAAIDAAARFCGIVRLVDARTRGIGRSERPGETAQWVEEEFWRLVDVLGAELDSCRSTPMVRQRVRTLLVPWLRRSHFWGRALFNSRGPGSDFQLLESIYDVEDGLAPELAGHTVTKVLDDVFLRLATVNSARYRREWCRQLIASTIFRLERPIRILDVGCGGSRYTRDALQMHPAAIRFAGTDEDPNAVVFLRAMLPDTAIDRVGLLCTSLDYLPDLVPAPTLPEAGFDLVLSAHVFDDLDNDAAIILLRHMSNLTRPGGVTAMCASTLDDRFRTIAEWVGDTSIHYRDASMVANLFARGLRSLVDVTVSTDRTTLCTGVLK